ncbi:hypothetical protein ACFL4T_08645, partial [candidate division KSB1 bacterium]
MPELFKLTEEEYKNLNPLSTDEILFSITDIYSNIYRSSIYKYNFKNGNLSGLPNLYELRNSIPVILDDDIDPPEYYEHFGFLFNSSKDRKNIYVSS